MRMGRGNKREEKEEGNEGEERAGGIEGGGKRGGEGGKGEREEKGDDWVGKNECNDVLTLHVVPSYTVK